MLLTTEKGIVGVSRYEFSSAGHNFYRSKAISETGLVSSLEPLLEEAISAGEASFWRMTLTNSQARHQIARLPFRCATDPVAYLEGNLRGISKAWLLSLRAAYKVAILEHDEAGHHFTGDLLATGAIYQQELSQRLRRRRNYREGDGDDSGFDYVPESQPYLGIFQTQVSC